jgi:hypothetical protein
LASMRFGAMPAETVRRVSALTAARSSETTRSASVASCGPGSCARRSTGGRLGGAGRVERVSSLSSDKGRILSVQVLTTVTPGVMFATYSVRSTYASSSPTALQGVKSERGRGRIRKCQNGASHIGPNRRPVLSSPRTESLGRSVARRHESPRYKGENKKTSVEEVCELQSSCHH